MPQPVLDSRRVRRNFSASADDYDGYARTQRRVAERLVELILEEGCPQGAVLDIGTGTGSLSRELAARCPGLDLILSDLAHGMTRYAVGRLPQTAAVDADAEALPLRDGALGLVMSSSVYQWLPDLTPAFRENARVLTSGGRFAFALFGDGTLLELRQSHRRAAAECGRHPSHVQSFPTVAQVEQALAAAGFAPWRLLVETEIERHRDVGEVLHSLKRIGARNAAAGRPPGLPSRQVMQRMIELYRQDFGGAGTVPATFEVIYGLAVKPPR